MTNDKENLKKINQIINELSIAKEMYYSGNPILSDQEFDLLETKLKILDPDNPYFKNVGVKERGLKVKHRIPMGGLNQKDSEELKKIFSSKTNILISDKLDGNSVAIYYDDEGNFRLALTRGDGIEGLDITRHFLKNNPFPKKFLKNAIVRGECIISNEDFKNIKKYKHPRNYIAGQLNSKVVDKDFKTYARFVAFDLYLDNNQLSKSEELDLLKEHSFEVVKFELLEDFSYDYSGLVEILEKRIDNSEYLLDGLVLEFNSKEIRENLGFDGLYPNFSFKFKINNKFETTTITEIIWNISKDNYLKPKIKFQPVEIDNIEISYATAFNAKYILDNKLSSGCEVEITRSGDVIPYIHKILKNGIEDNYQKYFDEMISKFGEYFWSENKVDLILKHKTRESEILNIEYFFENIKVAKLKKQNITRLYEAGFTTIESIISAGSNELSDVLGKIAFDVHQSIRERLNPIKQHVLMGSYPSFGRGVSISRFEKLAEAFQGKDLTQLSLDEIIAVDGFDSKISQRIIDGMEEFKRFFSNVKPFVTIEYLSENTSGSFYGKVVCFTGVRDKELEKMIREEGGKVSDSFTKAVNLLVTRDETFISSKVEKAKVRGVRVVTINEIK